MMDDINETSSNSLGVGGVAGGIPNDGTGEASSRNIPFKTSSRTANSSLLPGVIKLDPWLEPFKDPLRERYSKAQKWISTINETEGGLDKFSRVRQLGTIN